MCIILHLRHILVGTRVTTTANDALASELNQKKMSQMRLQRKTYNLNRQENIQKKKIFQLQERTDAPPCRLFKKNTNCQQNGGCVESTETRNGSPFYFFLLAVKKSVSLQQMISVMSPEML